MEGLEQALSVKLQGIKEKHTIQCHTDARRWNLRQKHRLELIKNEMKQNEMKSTMTLMRINFKNGGKTLKCAQWNKKIHIAW